MSEKIPYKKIFGKTLVITTLVFVAGILVGYYIDNLRSGDVFDTLSTSELDAQSYLTEKEFFDKFGKYNCQSSSNRLSSLAKELGEIGYYIVSFEKKNVFKQKDYDYLLRKYFLLQVRTYTLFNEMKENCGSEYDLILFFYDPEDSLSELQGNVLDILVDEKEDLSIFSINFNYDGDVLSENFLLHYKINMTPTLVINEGVKKEGFLGKEEIEELLG